MSPAPSKRAAPLGLSTGALTRAGVKYLLSRMDCVLVTTEARATGRHHEEPDIFGWGQDGETTILIEVKVSRADFLADGTKPWRKRGVPALGRKRYYLAPAGMIEDHEVPDGWGILDYSHSNKRITQRGWPRDFFGKERAGAAESALLVATVRRMGLRATGGISCRCYTIPTSGRTEVFTKEA